MLKYYWYYNSVDTLILDYNVTRKKKIDSGRFYHCDKWQCNSYYNIFDDLISKYYW